MKKSDEDNSNGKMRKKAEEILKTRNKKSDYSLTESDALKLIHALEVHQIELELQNEELSLAKNELTSVSNKYTDLYDFAPNGYFTLSKEGKILELNFNGAELLGKEKSELANSQFGFFVEKNSIDDFTQFLQKVFTSLVQVNVEIVLLLNKNKNRTIYLTGIANENQDECLVSAVDITEKKLAEESLKNSKKRFEDLVKLLPEAVFEIDKNLTLTYANQQAMDLFGYTQTDFTNGLNALEMLVPEEREKAKNIFAKRLKGEEPGTIEYRALKKDGSTFPILFHASSIVENGKLLGARGVIIDISELKHAEQELAKSEQKFKNIFNNSVVGKSITELDGNLKVNKAFSQIVGYSQEELNHKKWHEFTHTDDVKKNQEIVESVLSGKTNTARWEKRYIHKKGHIVWVDISTTLQRDDGGQPQFLITSVADITERKKAEKELREYKDLFSLFMQHSPVYTFIKEVSETQSKVIQASDNYKDMVGLPGSEMIGKTMEELFPPEFAENITADDLAAVKEGKVVQVDENFNNRNYTTIKFPLVMENRKLLAGYTIDMTDRKKAEEEILKSYNLLNNLTSMVPGVVYQYRLYPDGRSAFPISSPGMYDIYEVTPEEVKEDASPVFTRIHPDDYDSIVETINESAEKLTQYHSEFRVILPKQGLRWRLCDAKPERLEDGSTLWHGIISDITDRKNAEKEIIKAKEKAQESDRLKSAFLTNMSHEIRTPMNGILGFAGLLKEPQLTGEQQQKYVAIIEKSGQRMLNTINNIISISKIESGQMDVSISKFDITQELENILSFFKPEAAKKDIGLMLKKEFLGDGNIILSDKEKLNSILINLVKNAIKYSDKGQIEFGFIQIKNELEFYVKDTGTGIPEDRHLAIFDRFVQADIEDKQAKEGSGLGLAISKSFVELLGGKIWIESIEGKGSTFFFTIPYKPLKKNKNGDAAQQTKNESISQIKNLKVLIAEDDKVSEMLTETMIESFSGEILKAKTGPESVEICRKNPDIDLIIMDIRLPKMDGYLATREIRKFNTQVIILAQTAFALEGDREKAIEAGCNDYISKPVNKDVLLKSIEKHCAGKNV